MVMRREDIARGGVIAPPLGGRERLNLHGGLTVTWNKQEIEGLPRTGMPSEWKATGSPRDSFPLMCVGVASLPTTGSLAARGNKEETCANYPYPNWRI